jgi:hypothetical protein
MITERSSEHDDWIQRATFPGDVRVMKPRRRRLIARSVCRFFGLWALAFSQPRRKHSGAKAQHLVT